MIQSSVELQPAIVWFRDDLRLSDHPALHAAVASGRPVLPIFIFDQESAGIRSLGGASRWWLHHALSSLSGSLKACGARLHLFTGAALPILEGIVTATDASVCHWHRRYGAAERAVDDEVRASLAARGVEVSTYAGALLHEPDQVRPKAGGQFRVFTPFLKASLALGQPDHPLPAPKTIAPAGPATELPNAATLSSLRLLPTKPDWAAGLRATWTPGEAAAQTLLHDFVDGGLPGYAEQRNRPSLAATSRLSPHLRFGEISPRQVFSRASHAAAEGTADPKQIEKFTAEVIWRDFAYNLLVQYPDLATKPVQPAFEHFPYEHIEKAKLDAWHYGRTGYPIVDAGMRQLWTTSVMHNRVRMITASFLIKHLLADWRVGEAWFWDTLCDADPASNAVNWQWVAGSGADPSPYFRIFNPILQGQKFDPDGAYVRRFVPELANVPRRWIHAPWTAPAAVLKQAGVRIGSTYPKPIVEHEAARKRALAGLASMRAAMSHHSGDEPA